MDFYLINAAGKKFHFPVNPEELVIRRERQFETISLISVGEVDMAQEGKVKEITFSSFFPVEYDASYCRYPNVPKPQHAMNELNNFLADKKPMRLLISETAVNVLVLVSAHDTTMKGGEPGDVYFDVTCRTWRDAKVRTEARKATGGAASGGGGRPDTKPTGKVYTVKSGDSLSAIAKRELGDSSKWRQIYDKNKAIIGKDPNKIKPGQKLVMP